MRDVYNDLRPTIAQQEDDDWWDEFIEKAVNSTEYDFEDAWIDDEFERDEDAFVIIEMINVINKYFDEEFGDIFMKDNLTYSKIFKNYAYCFVARQGGGFWRDQRELYNEYVADMGGETESVEEEYNGSKDFPPNETDEHCPICLEAYTEENPKDGIRCSNIPNNCSHYCCERCWYVIWGQHNDTNKCPICKRDITMWLSTHYPNQAITDFLKTLPPK
jgi:hypothetical protein